jgi:hypothetical protein
MEDFVDKFTRYIGNIFSVDNQKHIDEIDGVYTAYTDIIDKHNKSMHDITTSLKDSFGIKCDYEIYKPKSRKDFEVYRVADTKQPFTFINNVINLLQRKSINIDASIRSLNAEITPIQKKITLLETLQKNLCSDIQDNYFKASLQQFIVPTPAAEYCVFALLHPQWNPNSDNIDFPRLGRESVHVYIPHSDILHWCIANLPQLPQQYTYLIMWFSALINQPENQQHRAFLNQLKQFITNFVITVDVTHLPFSEIGSVIDQYKFNDLRLLIGDDAGDEKKDYVTLVATPSPHVEQRLRNKPFGRSGPQKYPDGAIEFTYTYIYHPNEYARDNAYESEDTLLFTIEHDDFFVVVSDGVSQACFSDIASRTVAQMLYVAWKFLQKRLFPIENRLEVVRTALQAAKLSTAYHVQHRLDNPPDGYSSTIMSILRNLNKEGGSQSTFSCVFSFEKSIYCIWMGNSAIRIEGDNDAIVLDFLDERFKRDNERFSSTALDGMRGNLQHEIFPNFLTHYQKWRVGIHSDALDEYPDRATTLYQHPLQQPDGRPFAANDEFIFNNCIPVDDTTFIELYGRQDITS